MTDTIDSLIEMALDFSEFGVRDPHDPEFHSTMVGERVTVYIPVTTDNFWEVIKNGIQTTGLHAGQSRLKATVYLEQIEASDQARSFAYEKNHGANGVIMPMVIVAEKKIVKPLKTDDLMAELSFKAGAIKAQLIDAFIRPQDMVSVVYPAVGTGWDIPIREFVRKAKYGHYEPAIPGHKATGLKFGRATPPPWQYIILRRVQDLLNYSSNYYDYLTGDEQGDLTAIIVREATKVGFGKMWYWTGKELMEWVYSVLPLPEGSDKSKEDDIDGIMHATSHEGSQLPLYQVYKKYKDEMAYEIRSGKKPAPEPHD